jgi:hypothetical protein
MVKDNLAGSSKNAAIHAVMQLLSLNGAARSLSAIVIVALTSVISCAATDA